MYIDKKSPIPAYFQLINIIREKINLGEYPYDSSIPSERDLSDSLSISRMTVRQALNQLVNEGILSREKGRGTFVCRPKLEQNNIMSFSDAVRSRGLEPVTRLMFFEKETCSETLLLALDLKSQEKVYNIKRLRLAGDMPVAIEQNFIPEKYCPKLEKYDLTTSLYYIIKNEYGFSIMYVDHVITAAKPGREEKELLSLSGSIPVLKVSCVNYISSDIKLFYENSIYRSDEYQYNLRVYVNKHG